MSFDDKDMWYSRIEKKLESICQRVEEKVDEQNERMKACEKQNEMEMKVAQESKLNTELTNKLEELNRRCNELDRACANLKSKMTIADSDQNRLDAAKEMYEIAKEITGVRFDFSTPPEIVKGYVKNKSRKLLETFEFDAENASDGLWKVIESISASDELLPSDEENMPPMNK